MSLAKQMFMASDDKERPFTHLIANYGDLSIFASDISDPFSASVVASDTTSTLNQICQNSNRDFIAFSNGGAWEGYSFSKLTNTLTSLGTGTVSGLAFDTATKVKVDRIRDLAFFTYNSSDSISVVDISDAAAPTLVHNQTDSLRLDFVAACWIDEVGQYIYSMGAGASGLLTKQDIADPASWSSIAQAGTSAATTSEKSMDGNSELGLLFHSLDSNLIRSVDISSPSSMTVLQQTSALGITDECWAMKFDPDRALLLAVQNNPGKLHIIDVSDPGAMVKIGQVALPSNTYNLEYDRVSGIAFVGYNYIASDGNGGIAVFDCTQSLTVSPEMSPDYTFGNPGGVNRAYGLEFVR